MQVPRIARSRSTWASARRCRQEDPGQRGGRHAKIAGQKPVVTKARKSIANFKIRAGYPSAAW
jgi:hypothetical protein